MIDDFQDMSRELSRLLGSTSDLRTAVERAVSENADLKHQVENFVIERTNTLVRTVLEKATIKNGVKVCRLAGPILPEMVKNVAFSIRKESEGPTVFIGSTVNHDKPLLTVMISDDLVKEGYNASQIVRESAKLIKGGGGGQPFFAQAGGKDADNLPAAVAKIEEMLHLS